MSHELYYTSAPKGLQPGSRGFCTVAMTRGMPANLVDKVESLSGYRPLYPPRDPRAGQNPVVQAHLRIAVTGKSYSVLSRICDAGLDYTQRSNKFAHHVVLDAGDFAAARGGPAWLLGRPGFMEAAWNGDVGLLPAPRPIPSGDVPPAVCNDWRQATGDAGWAGVLAEAFAGASGRVVFLVFQPGSELLPLIAEAVQLLPLDQRWSATFSTYFTGLAPGIACTCRGIVAGSPEVAAARQVPGSIVLDLTKPLGRAPNGAYVEMARTGAAPLSVPMPAARHDPIEDYDADLEADFAAEPKAMQARPAQPAGTPARGPQTPSLAPPPSMPPPPKPARRPPTMQSLPLIPIGIAAAAVLVVILGMGSAYWSALGDINRLKGDIRAVETEIQQLQNQLATANKRADEANKQLGAAEKTNRELERQVTHARTEDGHHDAALEKLRGENLDLKKERDDALRKLRAAEEKIKDANAATDPRNGRTTEQTNVNPMNDPPRPASPRYADPVLNSLESSDGVQTLGNAKDLFGRDVGKEEVSMQLFGYVPKFSLVHQTTQQSSNKLTLVMESEGQKADIGVFTFKDNRLLFQWTKPTTGTSAFQLFQETLADSVLVVRIGAKTERVFAFRKPYAIRKYEPNQGEPYLTLEPESKGAGSRHKLFLDDVKLQLDGVEASHKKGEVDADRLIIDFGGIVEKTLVQVVLDPSIGRISTRLLSVAQGKKGPIEFRHLKVYRRIDIDKTPVRVLVATYSYDGSKTTNGSQPNSQ